VTFFLEVEAKAVGDVLLVFDDEDAAYRGLQAGIRDPGSGIRLGSGFGDPGSGRGFMMRGEAVRG
jgi:hypothetical protein